MSLMVIAERSGDSGARQHCYEATGGRSGPRDCNAECDLVPQRCGTHVYGHRYCSGMSPSTVLSVGMYCCITEGQSWCRLLSKQSSVNSHWEVC